MAEKIVITSGKGGVGKTTFTINLGLALAKKGKRVVLLDFDFGLNNLDVVSNVENLVVFDLIDVLNNRCRAKQALIKCPYNENLFVLPTSHSLNKEIENQNFKSVIEDLDILFDYVLIDCPAGIDKGFHRAVSNSDSAIVVTTAHLSSIRDADKVLSILKSYNLKSINIVINRYRGDLALQGVMFSISDVENTLNEDVIGVIPEDDRFISGVVDVPDTECVKAYKIICDNLLKGERKIYDCFKKYKGFFGSIRKELKKKLWKKKR